MGWSITQKYVSEISSHMLNEILEECPGKFSNPIGNSKQSWGWSCGVDIVQKANVIKLSGSYSQSGEIALSFSNWLSEKMDNIGLSLEKVVFDWQ